MFLVFGGFSGGLTVLASAFGAHGLKAAEASERAIEIFGMAVRNQMYHTLALVAVGVLIVAASGRGGVRLLHWSGSMFLAGILLFSGTMYLYALTGERGIPGLTPVGGVAFVVGWFLLGIWALRAKLSA